MNMTHFINGTWIQGQGNSFDSVNPANGEMIWSGHEAREDEIQLAYHAARKAQKEWALTSLDDRIEILKQYQCTLEEAKEDLAKTIAEEAGKPFWEAKTEVQGMIGKLNASINAYHERTPHKVSEANGLETRLTHRPHGVVVILGPYNFPGHLPNGQIIPALLAGNTVLYKPSELTPLVAEKMIRCFEKANMPKGVVNLLQGGGNVGRTLIDLPINGVFFTGSYQTGRKINEQLASRPEVILALEMGGNNPLIIDEVSDLEGAIYNTIMSAFITSGQRCTCARRLIVPNSTFGDTFLTQLISKINLIRVGSYTDDPEPFMGPVISEKMAKSVLETQASLKKEGATSLVDSTSKGHAFLSPGLLDVSQVKKVEDEEVFGPLLMLHRYDHFDEAINKANQTSYGLSAGLMTDLPKHVNVFYQMIRAGIANINRPMTGAAGTAPFGGIGRSGNHRPAAFYASDFCAYPMASMVSKHPYMPETLPLGLD